MKGLRGQFVAITDSQWEGRGSIDGGGVHCKSGRKLV
jgi:hypothetical protein